MDYYYYSPSEDVFYPEVLKQGYIDAGTWPQDGMKVDESVYIEFTQNTPKGKRRVAGSDGLPTWGDIFPLSSEALQRQAEYEKRNLIKEIREKIEPLQDAVYLDVATEEEKTALTAWHRYRLALYQLDLSTAPSIDWPAKPE
ncbi:tail fiber assembly protein [Xenorhabdus bovienii]|uniref:Putative tail fiber assembly protein n=1 Tax=Xenorhabdus bovienii TaxID=40576 RepID=A0A0B6XBG8_XENBV|nr:tail fiber assembly protein [Xenorhabdus bovienii]CDM89614.1 putative tail fiber assembly protein [Xenorhabdus bovienii]